MKKEFLISIICPLYNKENYIKETINSVLNQTYLNWELIIVDDQSTDSSFSIAREFSYKYNNIKVFNRGKYTNLKGGSSCRNLGVSFAKGDFIMFLDADDVILPNCLFSRYDVISGKFDKNFFIFNHAFFYKNVHHYFVNNTEFIISKVLFGMSQNKKIHLIKRFLKYHLPFTISNVIWRKDFFLQVGGFDPDFSRLQDPQLHTKALLMDNISLVCVKYKSKPDVLIRLDPERHANNELGDEVNKFHSFIKNSIKYIKETKLLLDSKGFGGFSKYLNGYFYNAQIRYWKLRGQYLNDEAELVSNALARMNSARSEIGIAETALFRLKVRILKFLMFNTITRKMKLDVCFNFVIML